jgi:hypothetical protein
MEFDNKEIKKPGIKNDSARIEINPDYFSMRKSPGETGKAAGETLNRDVPSQQRPIDYLGDDSKIDKAEIKKAGEMIMSSLDFIKRNANTPLERKTAEVLSNCKIVLCDTVERRGKKCFGFFSPHKNPEYAYIGIDLKIALNGGKAELIDTVFHEAYHAAQFKAGNRNDTIKEETRAWNLGLDMSNKYRREQGEYVVITKPYTEQDMYMLGYHHQRGRTGFVEIC